MPTLPLPIGGASPDAGALPVSSDADVLATLPTFLRPDDAAPVRDAIVAGITAMCLAAQERGGFAAAQADVLRATGPQLVEIGLERGIAKNGDELDEDYRTRILTAPLIVTPVAIVSAAKSVLAPYTAIAPKYCESIADRGILRSITAPKTGPRSFRYKRASTPRSPDYPDRYYESEASQNAGFSVANREPGAMRMFRDRVGRFFILRVPDVSSVDLDGAYLYADMQNAGFYVSGGQANAFSNYLRTDTVTSTDIYKNICNVVNRIKGHSIRWSLFVDPKLTA